MIRTYGRQAVAGLAVGALFLTGTVVVSAQSPSALPSGVFEITALRTARSPVIDGEVGDAEWQSAAVVRDFIQFEPRRGDPSEVRTEALVLYDPTHLYVAFRAWDAEPMTAQLTQRDADLLRDDAVAVLLDTTFDRRSGYYFITNALGTQADGRVAEDGRSTEESWDAPWQSAARRTDDG